MSAKNILNIVSKKISSNTADGISKGNLTNNRFPENFLDSIKGASRKLQLKENCSDNLINYFNKSTGIDVRQGYDWVNDNVNLQTAMTKMGGVMDKVSPKTSFSTTELTKSLCLTTSQISRTITFYIENVLNLVIVLFNKIDKYKVKLEKAILDFGNDVRDCIFSVIVDAKTALNKTVENITDFDLFIPLMNNCPCIKEILKGMFPQCADIDDANDIIDCIKTSYGLDPATLLKGVNKFIDRQLLDNINNGFNIFERNVKDMIESVISPIRDLVKAYCRLLNKKNDLSSMIRLLKKSSTDCLVIYTKERNSDGSEFFGMSVLDMLNSMKLWTSCLETVCSTFSDDTRRKILEYNEKLRLSVKFWADPNMIDIALSCSILNTQKTETTKSTDIRKIYLKTKGSGKDVFTELLDIYKDKGKIDVSDLEEDDKKFISLGPVADATVYASSPDQESTPIVNGKVNFKKGVESDVIKIISNMEQFITKATFYERLNDLLLWDSKFSKTQKHIDAIEKAKNAYERGIKETIPIALNTSIDVGTSSRPDFGSTPSQNIPVLLPNYVITDDYKELKKVSKPVKNNNESDLSLYTRWFQSELAVS